jgi:4-amino-4-deoxy-L-arabinose transferase-like glycosyltransferase
MRLFGSSVAVARTVTVLAGLATLPLVWTLARRLYTVRVAAIATALMALAPGVVLVSRNVQVDSMMVMLQTASVLAYVLAVGRKDQRFAWLGGALLGLALATKLPAILVVFGLAIWETWRTGSVKWVGRSRTWAYAGGAALVGVPWYAYRLISNGAAYWTSQAGVGGQASLMNWDLIQGLFANEWYWLHSPLFALAALGGLVVLGRDRTSGDRLVLAMIAVQAVFFLFFHFHSYYLIAMVPYTAIAAARGLGALVDRVPRPGWALVAVVTATTMLAGPMMMAGNKYGRWSPKDARDALGAEASDVNLYAEYQVWANYDPTLDLYLSDAAKLTKLAEGAVFPDGWEPEEGKREILLIAGALRDPASGQSPPEYRLIEESAFSVLVPGFSITQTPVNPHFFYPGEIRVTPGQPIGQLGFGQVKTPSTFHLYDLRVLQPGAPSS